MNKLLKNYNLSLWIVRIVYVLLSVYTQYALVQYFAEAFGITGEYYVLFASFITALLYLLIFPAFVGLLLNVFRIYFVPVAEFKLLALFCADISLAIVALCKLLILVVPVAGLWLTYIGGVIAITIGMGVFYYITSKNYTNDMTKPYYLRSIIFAYVIFIILGV